MKPLTNGHYLSEQFHTEEMHAGVRIYDSYYRFLQFFTDGFWLWSSRNSDHFDFSAFVRDFDHEYWRSNHRKVSRPTSRDRDGDYLFQFGTYVTNGKEITTTFYCPIAEMPFSYRLTLAASGAFITGWNNHFRFQGKTNPRWPYLNNAQSRRTAKKM